MVIVKRGFCWSFIMVVVLFNKLFFIKEIYNGWLLEL